MTKQIILVNPRSNNSKNVVKYLKLKNISYSPTDQAQNKIREGYKDFIICGGDGTINKFVNMIMELPEKERSSIKIGIVPCGRANDLARYMEIPLDTNLAFEKLRERNTKNIDLIKVNDNYIITGGGIGLPSETVEDVDKFSNSFLGRHIKIYLGDLSYLIFTLKKFVFGYKGVEVILNGYTNNLLAIYILNQPFLGKRFNLAPNAKNNDGLFEVKIVEIPPTFISHFKTLSKGLSGKLKDLKWIKEKKVKKISFTLKEPLSFMGDGEVFKPTKDYTAEIIPRGITIFC